MFRKIYFEITNICNLSCSFCPGTKRERKFIGVEDFSLLASKLRPHTDYLYFHLMGEPLMHPNLKQLLVIADELGFKIIITTNGTLLEQKSEVLLNCPSVHKVNISLQSFEANDSENLDNYIQSCASFAKIASESGKIAVLRLWNNNGLNSLNPKILEILRNIFDCEWQETRKGIKLHDRVWLENGDKFDWPDLNAEDSGEKRFCYGLRDQLGILCDGTVVPCCLDHEGDIALGSLFDNTLDEILNTQRAKSIYNGFSQRTAVEELCRKCGYSKRFK